MKVVSGLSTYSSSSCSLPPADSSQSSTIDDIPNSPQFRILDASYGPAVGEVLPSCLTHTLFEEMSRYVVPQLENLLRWRQQDSAVQLELSSLNALFGDPAPMVYKELRVAVER